MSKKFVLEHRARGLADSSILTYARRAGITITPEARKELRFRPKERPTPRAPGDVLVRWAEKNVGEVGLALMLSLHTSLRAGDVLNLRWEDVDNGVLTVATKKTGKKLRMLLPDRVLAYLTQFETCKGRMFQMSYTTWWRRFKDVCRALGLPEDLAPHSLRVAAIFSGAGSGGYYTASNGDERAYEHADCAKVL